MIFYYPKSQPWPVPAEELIYVIADECPEGWTDNFKASIGLENDEDNGIQGQEEEVTPKRRGRPKKQVE